VNFTSMMARFIRGETGIAMDGHITKYDGEPFEPLDIIAAVKDAIANKKLNLELSEAEAKEIAYHYLRTHYAEKLRPVKLTRESANGHGEPVWTVELAERASGNKGATMKIGAKTGSTYTFDKHSS
jgi:hypothetical protein